MPKIIYKDDKDNSKIIEVDHSLIGDTKKILKKLISFSTSYKKNIDSAKLAQQQRIQDQRTAVQMERINASKKR